MSRQLQSFCPTALAGTGVSSNYFVNPIISKYSSLKIGTVLA